MPSGPIEPRARSAKSLPFGIRCRCTAVSVFMNTKCWGSIVAARAVGAVDHQGQPLRLRHLLGVHQVRERAHPDHSRTVVERALPAPADRLQVPRCALPAVRHRIGVDPPRAAGSGRRRRRSCHWWREAMPSRGRRHGRRPPGRAASISAANSEMRLPGRSTQARTRTGATGIAPRMSIDTLAMRNPESPASSSMSLVIRASGGEPC